MVILVVRKLSISLPEDLVDKLDKVCKRLGVSRSEFIADVLREKLGEIVEGEKEREYPTVLWRLRYSGYLRYRSPRYPTRKIKEKWIIEEVKE